MHDFSEKKGTDRDRTGRSKESQKRRQAAAGEGIPPRSWQFAKEIYLFPGDQFGRKRGERDRAEWERDGRDNSAVGTHSHPRGVRFVQSPARFRISIHLASLPLRPRNARERERARHLRNLTLTVSHFAHVRRSAVRWPHSATLSPARISHTRATPPEYLGNFLKAVLSFVNDRYATAAAGEIMGECFTIVAVRVTRFVCGARRRDGGGIASPRLAAPSLSPPPRASPVSGIGD